MATVKIPLTEQQQFIAGHVYDNLSQIAELRAELKSLDAAGKKLKAELTKQLRNKAEYNAVLADDDIELIGKSADGTTEKYVYLSRDIRKSEINSIGLIKRLTKVQMLSVMNWSLKNLLRLFPKLYQANVALTATGSRKFSIVKGASETDANENDNDATED
ncbi:MAG TPA: hypothetical protein VNX68_11825 [Nitrosopumilaceae archaeon]|jgi:hypothetical protein|nr:hypothetical protein [Nitrosopumilaceae archaeon]